VIYRINDYCPHNNAHKCEDENNQSIYIDLMVSDEIEVEDENYDQFVQDLIGKSVEVGYLTHYVAIGNDIKIIEEVEK
tara:strand:- start:1149 stop:1382 length:234 start_codon:yes stop_codon:yes gene_type:complete